MHETTGQLRERVVTDLLNGTPDPDRFLPLGTEPGLRVSVMRETQRRIEAALRRQESRTALILDDGLAALRDDLAKILAAQCAAGLSHPKALMGSDRIATLGRIWSDRLRLLIWSGTLPYIWGCETIEWSGNRWGVEGDGWNLRLMRHEAGQGLIPAGQDDMPPIPGSDNPWQFRP